jgi:hypothetical protein
MSSYNLSNIRLLLTEGFTDTELRQFCYDTIEFRPVYDPLGERTGKAEIIHRLPEHADRKDLLAPLLAWAETQSQAKYVTYQPYQAGPTPLVTANSTTSRNCRPSSFPGQLIWLRPKLSCLPQTSPLPSPAQPVK